MSVISAVGWRSKLERWGPLAAMLAGVAAWLWPLGVGGRMPVGGDVTQFSIGLMGFLSDSLKAGRLPIWNDRWGYGFPGLAESQMGVYYPPHLALYGPLFTELAYTLSLVFHTFLCALGAYWAARQWGTSRIGAALSGFCFATCGFFVIHLPHQWGYTVAAWMPWAWGLAWRLLTGRGSVRTALVLAAVLAVQVLPGHFQIAFITQVMIGLIAVTGLVRTSSRRGAVLILLALVAVVPLTACQLWPTWQLAQRAANQRDYEYLSGFAVSPFHLVSYVVPRLFHDSPLWRPLAWDPFRTSPEEHLGYIGLAPLWLAFVAMWRRRQEPGVRLLGVLVLVSVLLSLGPYMPGFRWYCQLPGFSFFRAPARWGVATMLGLALLAGLGFDALVAEARKRGRVRARSVLPLLVISAVWASVPVLSVELHQSSRETRRIVETTIAILSSWLHWEDRPIVATAEPAEAIFRALGSPSTNPIVQAAMLRQGRDPASTFLKSRSSAFRAELLPAAGVALALFLLSLCNHFPRVMIVGLLVLTMTDLLSVKSLRSVEEGPIRPLVEQSPVLKALADAHCETGGRSADSFGNLAMVGGGAPVNAYRTIDLPVPNMDEPGVNLRGGYWERGIHDCRMIMLVCDIAIWVESFDVYQDLQTLTPLDRVSRHEDRALGSWLYGRRSVENDPAKWATFITVASHHPGSRAHRMIVARSSNSLGGPGLPYRSRVPEQVEVDVDVSDGSSGGGLVVISSLWDPEWSAEWVSDTAGRVGGTVESIFDPTMRGGWQSIGVPGPGQWTLHLRYEGRAARLGQIVSGVSWLVWLGLWFVLWRPLGANRPGPGALRDSGSVPSVAQDRPSS